MCQQLSRS